MLNIKLLRKQHDDASEIIRYVLEKVNMNTVEEDAMEIGKNISILAGKLKIHLNSEDKWLYPALLKSNNKELKQFYDTYYNEMKDIVDLFTSYKNKYNTQSKIISNINEFKDESIHIFTLLTNRIKKENEHLYTLLEEIGY